MLTTRWNELEQNIELASVLKKQKPSGESQAAFALDFNGVLVEKDISPKINSLYKEKILLMFDPLRSQSDEQIKAKLEQKGIRIQPTADHRLVDLLAEFVADQCYSPAKGTAARKTVYDIAEAALDAGELKIHVYPDTIPFLDKLKNRFVRIVLSRGSLSLLIKSCKGSGLFERLDEIETTIPYGNVKTAETFTRFVLEQQKKNHTVAGFLEDEFEVIEELVLASVWLQKHKQPGFMVAWIDRDNELAAKKEQFEALTKWIEQNGFPSKLFLQRNESLTQVIL